MKSGEELEIGPGFVVSIFYPNGGNGIDDEGAHFNTGFKSFPGE